MTVRPGWRRRDLGRGVHRLRTVPCHSLYVSARSPTWSPLLPLHPTACFPLAHPAAPAAGAGAAVPRRDCRRRQQGPDPQVQGRQDAAVRLQDGARVRAVQVRLRLQSSREGCRVGCHGGLHSQCRDEWGPWWRVWVHTPPLARAAGQQGCLVTGLTSPVASRLPALQAHAAHAYPQLLPGWRLHQAGGKRSAPAEFVLIVCACCSSSHCVCTLQQLLAAWPGRPTSDCVPCTEHAPPPALCLCSATWPAWRAPPSAASSARRPSQVRPCSLGALGPSDAPALNVSH